jgi:hypothetical protein
MIDAGELGQTFSYDDEDDVYEVVEFDPETTSETTFDTTLVTSYLDDEIDNDTLAFRDAVRDICATEGAFELILP